MCTCGLTWCWWRWTLSPHTWAVYTESVLRPDRWGCRCVTRKVTAVQQTTTSTENKWRRTSPPQTGLSLSRTGSLFTSIYPPSPVPLSQMNVLSAPGIYHQAGFVPLGIRTVEYHKGHFFFKKGITWIMGDSLTTMFTLNLRLILYNCLSIRMMLTGTMLSMITMTIFFKSQKNSASLWLKLMADSWALNNGLK